ncbi:hypothetical protein [Maritimibacter dapengensis]|uniref:Outer membrane protein beta-barrel domain-containing protein n=1 Tax=Maritimibacter dapengensis TaxID=2836868 RepID=A0ABS6T388_9RHOB|nr:hypothetical protein [Maritimibacter dapengensis]MBV7379670.1 hypothetical protein [Maritimibacter dapengensis]
MALKKFLKNIWAGVLAACVALNCPSTVLADGTFFQVDASPTTANGTLSVERGEIAYGAGVSQYIGGTDLNASVTYKVVIGEAFPVTFRAGPAFQYEALTTAKVGLRFVAEHYSDTSFGHVFALGEFTTIDAGYFGLLAVGFNEPDVDFEFTVQGDNKGYLDQSVAATIGIPETKARVRFGYRINSQEIFGGISINTF